MRRFTIISRTHLGCARAELARDVGVPCDLAKIEQEFAALAHRLAPTAT